MNIGILGGTFDPVHNGHIKVAEIVKAHLDLAKVVFMPAGQPWLKSASPVSPAEYRVEMVRLAIAGCPGFELSLLEINRPGPSYTVDTIEEFRDKNSDGNELFFILGQDSLSQLPRWKEPNRIIELCRLAAVPRPGCQLPDLKQLEKLIPGLSSRLVLLDKPEIDISATQIRKRVAEGLSIRGLVPEAVAEYIKRHKLYVA